MILVGLVVGRPYDFDDKGREKFNQMVADQCYGADFSNSVECDCGALRSDFDVAIGCVVQLGFWRKMNLVFGGGPSVGREMRMDIQPKMPFHCFNVTKLKVETHRPLGLA